MGTMLEKLGFKKLVEERLTVKRIPKVMSAYQFLLAMVLGFYIGFTRLNQLRFVARDPMLTGVLKVTELPPQSTFWRFLASLQLARGATNPEAAKRDAAARVGSGAREVDNRNSGHRYDSAHAIRRADGRAEEL